MDTLQTALYFTQHIRACEQSAYTLLKLTEDTLMSRAAEAAFGVLKDRYPNVRSIAVFCGSGNNAGDGYALAVLAQQHGFSVVVYQTKSMQSLPPAAHRAALQALAAGVVFQPVDDAMDAECDLIVDALLGIGLQGEVRGPIAHAIHVINDSGLPVLSLDVPSGLDADTGRVLGVCVKANITVTFIAPKVGLFTLDGPDYSGYVLNDSLQLETCLDSVTPPVHSLSALLLQDLIAPRPKNIHKGHCGHVLIIGGGYGMPGAVYLSACAALRVGAGLVTIATSPQHVNGVLPQLPEAMIYAIEDPDDLAPLLKKATVCIIGPGLGESPWANALFNATMAAQLPLVVDASALRMLSQNPQHDDNWVLTPHPGEAAALLGKTVADVQKNRYQSAHRIYQQYGGCVVLKGLGTFVAGENAETYLCTDGNPGMATAGMGDVLSGVIGGLLAQGFSLHDAAKLGVWLHANAADDAVALSGERGLMASDLFPYLRCRINALT